MGYYFYLVNKKTEKRTKLSGEISDKNHNRLLKFLSYAEDLEKTKFTKSKITFQVSIGTSSDVPFSRNIPSDEVISDFLIKIRPFILKNEQTYFYSICNIISKSFHDDLLNLIMKDIREYYSDKQFQNMIKFESNNVILNSEDTLNDWLNAYVYHKDENKKQRLDSLHDSIFPFEMSKVLWLLLFQDQVKAIVKLSTIIRNLKKENNEE